MAERIGKKKNSVITRKHSRRADGQPINAPLPNATYKRYIDGSVYTWITDELGNTCEVRFSKLSLKTAKRNGNQQRLAGSRGKESFGFEFNTYDGGHLLASMFGGLSEKLNLVPMVKELNRGNYLSMERFIKQLVEDKAVISKGNISIQYVTGTDSPAFIDFQFTIKRKVYKYHFVNDPMFNVFGGVDVCSVFN